MTRASIFAVAVAAFGLAGCGVAPPASRFPDADAALDRMRATYSCARGVVGAAKIDHFSQKQGRIRGDLNLFAVAPELVRFDVVSPFGVTLSTLTSDGERFSLYDLKEKRFLEGPASECNIARLTNVPIPGHALVELMHGEAPVLVHEKPQTSIAWDSGGFFVLEIPSTRGASETIAIAPHPDDFAKPWGEQRVRILDVRVRQQGFVLYHAELKDHRPAPMSTPLVDDDGIDPPVPPSGPVCTVDVPRRVHVEVPAEADDVLFRYDEVRLNPPLPEGLFKQPIPGGVSVSHVGRCE